MTRGLGIVALLCAFTLGAVGALLVGRPAPVAQAPAATATRVIVPAPCPTGARATVDLAAIRAALREELDARAPETAPEPPIDTARVQESAAAGERRLEAALAAGRWRDEDRAALHGLVNELPGPERDRLLGHLAASINDGTLRVETAGPPF